MSPPPAQSHLLDSVVARQAAGDHDLPGVSGCRRRAAPSGTQLHSLPGLLLGALVLALLLAPLLVAEVPPLLDYPDHLARAYIIQNQGAEPLLQRWYQMTWRVVGNLTADAIMLALTPFMSVEAAGKLLLAIIQASTLAGVCLLQRALWGRWSLWSLAAIPVLWHGCLMGGFLNSSLSMGLLPIGLAAWVAMANRPLAQRVAVAVPVGLALYFTHLLGFAFFGIMVAGLEFAALRRAGDEMGQAARPAPAPAAGHDAIRRLTLLAATAALPLLLYVVFRPAVEDAELLGPWTFGPRARGLLMPMMGSDEYVRVGLTLLYAAGGLYLGLSGRLGFRRELLPGFAVLLVAYWLLPGTVDDNGHVPDRIGIAVLLVAIAGSRPQALGQRGRQALATLVALACLVQSGSVTASWRQSDLWFQDFRAALQQVPVGAKLLVTAPALPSSNNVLRQGEQVPNFYVTLANKPALSHMPSLAVMRGAFVPLIFTHPQKQTLALRAEVEKLALKPDRPVTIDNSFRASGAAGPALNDRFQAFDAAIVLYADLMTPAERERVVRHGTLFDNGKVVLVDNRAARPAKPAADQPALAQRRAPALTRPWWNKPQRP